jgi:hypothetical protein
MLDEEITVPNNEDDSVSIVSDPSFSSESTAQHSASTRQTDRSTRSYTKLPKETELAILKDILSPWGNRAFNQILTGCNPVLKKKLHSRRKYLQDKKANNPEAFYLECTKYGLLSNKEVQEETKQPREDKNNETQTPAKKKVHYIPNEQRKMSQQLCTPTSKHPLSELSFFYLH